MLVVVFAWVLFRAGDLTQALGYWKALFDFNTSSAQMTHFLSCVDIHMACVFAITLLGAFGVLTKLNERVIGLFNNDGGLYRIASACVQICSVICYMFLLVLCSCYLLAGTYNPFIYYQF